MGLQLPSPRYIHPDFWELERFLGPSFQLNWCNALDEKGHEESQKYPSNEDFLRNSLIFVYQSIGLSAAGIHRPYLAELLKATADRCPCSVIDYGSGGGQDGLALHTLGYKVSFADIHSFSLMFLLWRLKERRLDLPVYMLDFSEEIPKHDIAICFDVVQHLAPDEQLRLFHRLMDVANCAFVNLIRGDGSELNGLHFAVDAEHLTKYIGDHWKVWHKDYYPDDRGGYKQRLIVFGDTLEMAEG